MRVDMMTSLKSIAARQAGVTGLETAIIVISFVVVASVFAFTILSTGILGKTCLSIFSRIHEILSGNPDTE